MSAIMMALVAGMAVSSDGTEQVSTKMDDQHLAICGNWEGIVQWFYQGELKTDQMKVPGPLFGDGRWIDEGGGNCRHVHPDVVYRGIYKRERGRLIICLGAPAYGRPVMFRPDGTQDLYILKPARPQK